MAGYNRENPGVLKVLRKRYGGVRGYQGPERVRGQRVTGVRECQGQRVSGNRESQGSESVKRIESVGGQRSVRGSECVRDQRESGEQRVLGVKECQGEERVSDQRVAGVREGKGTEKVRPGIETLSEIPFCSICTLFSQSALILLPAQFDF